MGGHLALLLAGGNGDPWTPPVLLPRFALEAAGAHAEVVPYPDFRPASLELRDATAFDAVVRGHVVRLLSSGDWTKVTFVAKSRGTLFLAPMQDVDLPPVVEAIWVTPVLDLAYVREGMVAKRWRSLVVSGSEDGHTSREDHDAVCAAMGATGLMIEGANHGLVVPGDASGTVDAYRQLAQACEAFAAI